MKFTTTIAALFATAAFAAPTPESATSQMVASAPQWTIQSLKRHCGVANKQCTWSFSINQNNGTPATPCSFVVKGANAADTNSANNQCGGYTVGTGWSGQFGAGNGFTTLSVVNNAQKQIIYPSYTDKQLAGGNVVTPNQSYAPAALP